MKIRKNTPNKERRRRRILHTTHPASSSMGVQFRSLARVARLNNVDDGSDGTVSLFLFERGPETVGACVAMQTEWSKFVDDSVPIREYEYRWSCEFRK